MPRRGLDRQNEQSSAPEKEAREKTSFLSHRAEKKESFLKTGRARSHRDQCWNRGEEVPRRKKKDLDEGTRLNVHGGRVAPHSSACPKWEGSNVKGSVKKPQRQESEKGYKQSPVTSGEDI